MTTKTPASAASKHIASTDAVKGTEALATSASANTTSSTQPRETKIGKVVKLLGRKNGATIEQIVEATGWQKHTARAALTGLKKKGHTIEREATERGSRYHTPRAPDLA